MSGRKTSTVTLGPSVLELLAAAARRRAAERSARRAAEADRRRREELRRRGEAVRTDLLRAADGLSAFVQTPAGQLVAGELATIGQEIANLQGRNVDQETAISDVAARLKTLRRQLVAVTDRAEMEQLATDVEQERAILLVVKRQAAAIRVQSTKFDPKSLREVDGLVAEVESLLKNKKLTEARQAADRLHARFVAHRELVEREQKRFAELREETEAALAEARQRISDLQNEVEVRRWSTRECEALVGRLSQAERTLERGQFSQVQNEVSAILAEAERIDTAAEQRQQRQDERDYVAKKVLEGLVAAGFWVETESAHSSASGTLFRATRHDGRGLSVKVPSDADQPLEWTPTGFPLDVVTDVDGRPARTCDEASEQIDAIKTYLATEGGIQTGDLSWPGKSPTRPTCAAKRASASTAPVQRRASELAQKTFGQK
jgi:hypothetical protein